MGYDKALAELVNTKSELFDKSDVKRMIEDEYMYKRVLINLISYRKYLFDKNHVDKLIEKSIMIQQL